MHYAVLYRDIYFGTVMYNSVEGNIVRYRHIYFGTGIYSFVQGYIVRIEG